MARKIENALYAIKTDTSWGYGIIIEASSDNDLFKYIAETESKCAVVLGVKRLTANGTARVAFRTDPYFKKWKKAYELINIAKNYGFRPSDTRDDVFIFYDDTFGNAATLFFYNLLTDSIYCECKNKHFLWLSKTRSDLTADKIIEFVSEVNKVLNLKGKNKLTVKNLIAPEDWQAIAKIDDAFKDKRYK